MAKKPLKPDFLINNHGTICVLAPMTPEAKAWTKENFYEDVQRWGTGIVIEPRFLEDIVMGLVNDGLTFSAS